MNRFFISVLIVSLIFCMVACSHKDNNKDIQATKPVLDSNIFAVASIEKEILSSKSLVEKSDYIFVAKVVGIDFGAYGFHYSDNSPNIFSVESDVQLNHADLYTEYHLEVIDVYKGTLPEEVVFLYSGGHIEYDIELQQTIIEEAISNGVDIFPHIPISYEQTHCDLGEYYVFLGYSNNSYILSTNAERGIWDIKNYLQDDEYETSLKDILNDVGYFKRKAFEKKWL